MTSKTPKLVKNCQHYTFFCLVPKSGQQAKLTLYLGRSKVQAVFLALAQWRLAISVGLLYYCIGHPGDLSFRHLAAEKHRKDHARSTILLQTPAVFIAKRLKIGPISGRGAMCCITSTSSKETLRLKEPFGGDAEPSPISPSDTSTPLAFHPTPTQALGPTL